MGIDEESEFLIANNENNNNNKKNWFTKKRIFLSLIFFALFTFVIYVNNTTTNDNISTTHVANPDSINLTKNMKISKESKDLENIGNGKDIAIIYVCTGKYVVFWEDFYKTMEKNFIVSMRKDYYVFTDSKTIFAEENENVHLIPQENLGWPKNTLYRFNMVLSQKKELQKYKYIFLMNANILCNYGIGEEFLPKEEGLLFVQHFRYYNKSNDKFEYERNSTSTAYIPMGEGKYYVCSGVNGGKAKNYLDMCEKLKNRIVKDEKSDIVAIYHDESHLNRYVYDIKEDQYKLLNVSYCYPEVEKKKYRLPFDPILFFRKKEKYIDLLSIKGDMEEMKGNNRDKMNSLELKKSQISKEIAIIYICTGKYVVFWEEFYKSMEKNFIVSMRKDYYVFTDSKTLFAEEKNNVHIIPQENLGWPKNTLYRFHMILSQKEELQKYKYIFFMNANIICNFGVGEEFLPAKENEKLLFVQHFRYYNRSNDKFEYERNSTSTAYIPMGEGKYYVCGGVNGGKAKNYLDMCEELKNRIEEDEKNDFVAIWHDESHINRYLYEMDVNQYKLLNVSYCFPEKSKRRLPFDPILFFRRKEKYIDLVNIKGTIKEMKGNNINKMNHNNPKKNNRKQPRNNNGIFKKSIQKLIKRIIINYE